MFNSDDDYSEDYEEENYDDRPKRSSGKSSSGNGPSKGLIVALVIIILLVVGLYAAKALFLGGNNNTTEPFQVSPSNLTINVGETGKVNAPSGSYFSSSTTSICTVDNTGTITGVSKGICIIVVRNGNNQGNCNVTINDAGNTDTYDDLKFKETSYKVSVGSDLEIEVLNGEEPVDSTILTWESSDPSIFIADNGKIIGVSKGSGTLTVSYEDKKITTEIIVEENSSVDSISIPDASLTLNVGETYTIVPVVTGNHEFIFEASADCVEVNTTGTVIALKAGTATITVKLKDNEEISTTMTVTVNGGSEDIPPVDDDPGDTGGDDGGGDDGGGDSQPSCQLFQISSSNSGGSISSTRGGNSKTFTTGSQLQMWINGGANCGVATKVAYCTSTTQDSCTLGSGYTAGSDYVDPIKVNLSGRGTLYIKIQVTYKDGKTQTKEYWMKYYLS